MFLCSATTGGVLLCFFFRKFEPPSVRQRFTIRLRSITLTTLEGGGRVGGAMVLGKLPVPGRPAYLDWSRTRAYYACSRCGRGLFGHFFSRLSFLFSFSLSLGDGPI